MTFRPFNQRLFQQNRPISDIAPFLIHTRFSKDPPRSDADVDLSFSPISCYEV
jgi:hypothetical protein